MFKSATIDKKAVFVYFEVKNLKNYTISERKEVKS